MAAKSTTAKGQKSQPRGNPDEWAESFKRAAEKCQTLLEGFIKNSPQSSKVWIATLGSASQAFAKMTEKLLDNPTAFLEQQLDLYRQYVELLEHTSRKFMGEKEADLYVPDSKDKRFADEAWSHSIIFDFIKQSYLMSARWLHDTTSTVKLDDKSRQIIDFYTRQYIDALAPSNFLATNPEVLRTTLESHGENLAKGLENLLEDLEQCRSVFKISSPEEGAFVLGKNIATTPGKIVFQNDLLQLIQYSPSTENVYKTPLLIVAPWINKYYILDMRPENSFIKWLVDQGHTVFVTSWVNPGPKLATKNFADYMLEGPLAALDVIEKITGEKSANVIGYCIGGTLMAATLAYLAAKGDQQKIRSVTYLTTLTDFLQSGDLGVFIDEQQLQKLEEQMREVGYLDGAEMSAVFSLLRANDMIWSAVVNQYLLGKEPLPFDLLYWNADSTRMPAAMHSFYLRAMYKDNLLVKKGGITLAGVPIDLTRVTTPAYMLSTKEDHIAPWQATYAATRLFKGPMRFVLTGSGHVAGVVNPPAKKKYGFWVSESTEQRAQSTSYPVSPDIWFKAAKEYAGSWWDDWQEWISKNGFTGETIPARTIKKSVEDAPGSYVKVK